jgi:O-antigen/teichoic acid export membrane protein
MWSRMLPSEDPARGRGAFPSIAAYLRTFLARSAALLGPLFVTVITARLLGPEDRGRYYYVMTLAAVGVQLASFGIQASNSFLLSKQPNLLSRILANTRWIGLLGGLAAGAGVLTFEVLVGDPATFAYTATVVIILCPLNLLFLYLTNIAVGMNWPNLFNGLIILNSVLLATSAATVALLLPELNSFLVAAIIASALTCILAWMLIAKDCIVPREFDWPLLSENILFAARAHVAILVGFLMARTGIAILRYYGAFGDIGYWSIAAQITDALLILPGTVGMLLFPALVRAGHADRWIGFTTVAWRVGAVMAVICAGAALVAHFVITIVFGINYASAVDITIALLPGVFFLSMASIASQFLSAFGIPWTQLAAWIVGWIAQAGLSLLVVGAYGVLGLAWTQSFCSGVVCAWLFVNALNYRPRSLAEGTHHPGGGNGP